MCVYVLLFSVLILIFFLSRLRFLRFHYRHAFAWKHTTRIKMRCVCVDKLKEMETQFEHLEMDFICLVFFALARLFAAYAAIAFAAPLPLNV